MKHKTKAKEARADTRDSALLLMELQALDLTEEELSDHEFEVLKAGEYYDSRYGKFKVTEERIAALKKNFDEGVLGVDVALDVGHEWEKGAFAWVKELSVRGGSLYAKFRDFTNEGKDFFLQKKFRYFSVEFAPFDKVEDGKKKTIMDVLRGIALTNRPVIKGMQPTFMSEGAKNYLLTHNTHMQIAKMFAERLLQRAKISTEDVNDLKLMVASLDESEQADVEEKVTEVEAKAAADAAAAEAEAKAAAEAEAKAKADAEAAAAAGKGEGEGDEGAGDGKGADAELAEVKAKAEKDAKELSELKAKEADRSLAEFVTSLTLSEGNLTGFAAAVTDDVKAFAATLSEDQRASFSKLVKSVTTIDESQLSELGHGKAGAKGDDDEKETAAKALAEKKVAAGMAPHQALAEAYKEVGAV